jgi:hypothetical protein
MSRPGVEVHDEARRELLGAGLLVVAAVVSIIEPLHGPVLLSFSGRHGLDVGDLVALPFLVAGLLLLRGSPAHQRLLRAAERVAGDLDRAAGWTLLATGACFLLVLVNIETSLPDGSSPLGGLALLLSLVGFAAVVVLLLDPATCDDVLGAPLWLACLAVLAGFVVDLTHPEAGPIMGPTVLAALLLVTLGRRARAARWTMAVLLVVFVFWDFVALIDPRTYEPQREAAGGGLGRVGALGVLMCAVGILTLVRRRTADAREG